jgi:hypothetical protein
MVQERGDRAVDVVRVQAGRPAAEDVGEVPLVGVAQHVPEFLRPLELVVRVHRVVGDHVHVPETDPGRLDHQLVALGRGRVLGSLVGELPPEVVVLGGEPDDGVVAVVVASGGREVAPAGTERHADS